MLSMAVVTAVRGCSQYCRHDPSLASSPSSFIAYGKRKRKKVVLENLLYQQVTFICHPLLLKTSMCSVSMSLRCDALFFLVYLVRYQYVVGDNEDKRHNLDCGGGIICIVRVKDLSVGRNRYQPDVRLSGLRRERNDFFMVKFLRNYWTKIIWPRLKTSVDELNKCIMKTVRVNVLQFAECRFTHAFMEAIFEYQQFSLHLLERGINPHNDKIRRNTNCKDS